MGLRVERERVQLEKGKGTARKERREWKGMR